MTFQLSTGILIFFTYTSSTFGCCTSVWRFDLYSPVHSTTTLNSYFNRGFYSLYINWTFHGFNLFSNCFHHTHVSWHLDGFRPHLRTDISAAFRTSRDTSTPCALRPSPLGKGNLTELLYKHTHISSTRFNLIFAETSHLNSHFPPGAFIAIHRPRFNMTFEHVPAVSFWTTPVFFNLSRISHTFTL